MNKLTVVDTEARDWEEAIISVQKTGRNFLIVINQIHTDIDHVCGVLDCDPKEMPERLGRWGIHALNDVLDPKQYEMLLARHRSGEAVYFIEQINLKKNCPPKFNPYLVYCEVRGIISHHESVEEAKTAFFEYLESFRRARVFLMVGIYVWRKTEWTRLRNVF
jgi:hypothetical protein